MRYIKKAVIVFSMLILLCSCGSKTFTNNPDAIANAASSILTIDVYNKDNNGIASGSGFIAFESDIIVTNFHVIDDAYRISATDEEGNKIEISNILAYNEKADIALLKTKTENQYKPLTLYSDGTLQKGEPVVAIGSPLGIQNTVSNGTLSGFLTEGGIEQIQFTAPISSGSSGGALFNDKGQVIGVTAASFVNGQNMNLAIPISEVKSLYDEDSIELSVEEFYAEQHPLIEYEEYYVGIRAISIIPEIYDSPESWEKARSYAYSIYDEWVAGDATEDSLVKIMDKYGANQGGGQLYIIEPGDFVAEIDQWCFDRERQIGDIAIIENPYGYSICYFSSAIKK